MYLLMIMRNGGSVCDSQKMNHHEFSWLGYPNMDDGSSAQLLLSRGMFTIDQVRSSDRYHGNFAMLHILARVSTVCETHEGPHNSKCGNTFTGFR